MSMQQSYKEKSHNSGEGMFRDITNISERFELYFSQLNFLDNNTKRKLFNLLQNYAPNFGYLNLYAYAFGYIAVVEKDGTKELTVTKESINKSYEQLKKNVNYRGVKLSTLIEKSDILRYARLYIRIQKNAAAPTDIIIDNESDTNDNIEDPNYNIDDEYNNEDVYGEYNEDAYGEYNEDAYREEAAYDNDEY